VTGFAIILGFNLMAMWLSKLLNLPLPANVLGLILFTASLYTGMIKLEWVDVSARWLSKHMMLFFIPYLVGTMTFLPYIGENFFSIVSSLVVSTFLVLILTGWVTSVLSKKGDTKENEYDA
jgi:holin-like protein